MLKPRAEMWPGFVQGYGVESLPMIFDSSSIFGSRRHNQRPQTSSGWARTDYAILAVRTMSLTTFFVSAKGTQRSWEAMAFPWNELLIAWTFSKIRGSRSWRDLSSLSHTIARSVPSSCGVYKLNLVCFLHFEAFITIMNLFSGFEHVKLPEICPCCWNI